MAVDRLTGTRTATVTSHSDPAFEKHGITHYGVTHLPGAYPRTSTMALTATTLPYVMQLAQKGVEALRQDQGFAKGGNTHNGYIICKPVAEAIGISAPGSRTFQIPKPIHDAWLCPVPCYATIPGRETRLPVRHSMRLRCLCSLTMWQRESPLHYWGLSLSSHLHERQVSARMDDHFRRPGRRHVSVSYPPGHGPRAHEHLAGGDHPGCPGALEGEQLHIQGVGYAPPR
jgi:hypothetical protein